MNDSVTREAISRAEERKFLRFVKEDPHFCRYYEGIYILFKTGLRISEFCGLPISDIDFKEHTINIDHQLQKKSKIGYYIQETKTTSGTRKILMTADVEECFRKIIEKRNPPKAEPMVDGKSGFLYFDKNEVSVIPCTGSIISNTSFRSIIILTKYRCLSLHRMYAGIPIAQIWQNPE